MAAAGRVCTGFSKPYVATYSNTGSVVTYSNGQLLARGVSVNLQPESAEDNNFYADNIVAESAAGEFIGGTVELEVDGLFRDTEDLIFGAPAAVDGWVGDGDANSIPFCGVGFIVRWMSDGVTKYQPVVLPKVKFNIPEEERATQEDEIDWKTQELVATCLRDDSANRVWKYVGTDYTTEAAAEAALQTKLGYVPPLT